MNAITIVASAILVAAFTGCVHLPIQSANHESVQSTATWKARPEGLSPATQPNGHRLERLRALARLENFVREVIISFDGYDFKTKQSLDVRHVYDRTAIRSFLNSLRKDPVVLGIRLHGDVPEVAIHLIGSGDEVLASFVFMGRSSTPNNAEYLPGLVWSHSSFDKNGGLRPGAPVTDSGAACPLEACGIGWWVSGDNDLIWRYVWDRE